MRISQSAASAAVAAIGVLLNGGSLVLYDVALPATPETALTGETALASWTFSATAFAAPAASGGNESALASLVAASVAPAAAGRGCFARALASDGSAQADLTVAAAWHASEDAVLGQYATNGGNLYVCTTAGTTAASGGPTGTDVDITDGIAHWSYVAAGSADVTFGNTGVQIGVDVSITSLSLGMPVP